VGRFFTEPNGRHLALLSALLGDDLALPWNQLTPTQQNTVLHGHPVVVRTTWAFERGKRRGEHALEERWEGVVALVNAEVTKRAKRKDAAAWQTAHSTSPCGVCAGSGLRAPAHRVTLNGHTWSALQNTPLHALSQQLGEPAAMGPVLLELHERLTSLTDLALGHLPLARRADHLSAGEFQRVRLAEVLDTALTGLTVVLDEPGRGLDVAGRHALSTHLRTLTERGNTVVFVSHHADLIAHADHCITLGPGAGANGGTVVRAGPPPSSTAPYRPRTFPPPPSQVPDRPGLFVLTGPSGSGKSTWLRTHGLAADKASSASTVAFALGWMAPIQKAFHAANPSLSRTTFSHRSAAGRCPTCKGEGTETVSLDILADLSLACGTCNGRRYRPEVLEARLCGLPIDAVLQLPLSALGGWVPALEGLAARAVQLGIGHLPVGIAPRRLSGGELQRLTLLLALGGSSGQLGLDDPTAGLHPDDVQHLLPVLSERVEQGATLVVVSDDPHLLAAATEVWSTPATTTLRCTLEIP
jgi:excinuclease UvrABC ATPase subunit